MTQAHLLIGPLLFGYLLWLCFPPKWAFRMAVLSLAGMVVFIMSTEKRAGEVMIFVFGFFGPILFGLVATGAIVGTIVRNLSRNSRAHVGILVTVALLGASVAYALKEQKTEQDLKEEEKLAESFARSHPDVVALVGAVRETSIVTKSIKQGAPMRYDIGVYGGKSVWAQVDATRTNGKVQFHLACISDLYVGQRESGKDVCAK